MSSNRNISDLRDHLFDAIEDLKSGKIDVAKAKAMANLGTVLVQSVKVEVDALKVMGGKSTGFVAQSAPARNELPEAPSPAMAGIPDGPMDPEYLQANYGKVGDRYYSRIETVRGETKLVEVAWRSLKGTLGQGGLDLVPTYEDYPTMETALAR